MTSVRTPVNIGSDDRAEISRRAKSFDNGESARDEVVKDNILTNVFEGRKMRK